MTILKGRVAWVSALALTLLLAVASGSVLASAPAPQQDKAAFEQTFLTMTIDHHFMGVEMGELCVAKGKRAKLRDVCQDIVKNQSAEIGEMRGYLRDWYGTDKEPMMPNDPLTGDSTDMAELEAARPGREFDVMVSEMFIEHHLLQIAHSKRCLRKAYHGELKDLCKRQIEQQASEIPIFHKVISSYSDDRGDHHGSGRHGHPHGHGQRGGRHHG